MHSDLLDVVEGQSLFCNVLIEVDGGGVSGFWAVVMVVRECQVLF